MAHPRRCEARPLKHQGLQCNRNSHCARLPSTLVPPRARALVQLPPAPVSRNLWAPLPQDAAKESKTPQPKSGDGDAVQRTQPTKAGGLPYLPSCATPHQRFAAEWCRPTVLEPVSGPAKQCNRSSHCARYCGYLALSGSPQGPLALQGKRRPTKAVLGTPHTTLPT